MSLSKSLLCAFRLTVAMLGTPMALCSAQPALSRCTYGDWRIDMAFKLDSAYLFLNGSAAESQTGNVAVVASPELFFRSAGAPALVAVKLPEKSIGAPRGNFTFVFPRGAIAPDGSLHVVWGEPAMPRGGPAPQSLVDFRISTLWHSVYRRGIWTQPVQVYASQSIQWDVSETSKLTVSSDGSLGLSVPADAGSAGGLLVYLRFRDGKWVIRTFSTQTPIVSVDLFPNSGDRARFVFVSGDRISENGRERVDDAVHFVVWDGTRWTKAVTISRADEAPAFEPHIIASNHGYTVVWTSHPTGSIQTTGLWFARSADDGRTWGPAASLPLKVQIHNTSVFSDGCGTIHVLLKVITPSGSTVGYTRIENHRWKNVTRLRPTGSVLLASWLGAAGLPKFMSYVIPEHPESAMHIRASIFSLTSLPRE